MPRISFQLSVKDIVRLYIARSKGTISSCSMVISKYRFSLTGTCMLFDLLRLFKFIFLKLLIANSRFSFKFFNSTFETEISEASCSNSELFHSEIATECDAFFSVVALGNRNS